MPRRAADHQCGMALACLLLGDAHRRFQNRRLDLLALPVQRIERPGQ